MLFRAFELRCTLRTRRFPARSVGRRLKTAVAGLQEWIESCADHYMGARLYEQLSRLSDAELALRGLRRETLVRDLIGARRRRGTSSSTPEARR